MCKEKLFAKDGQFATCPSGGNERLLPQAVLQTGYVQLSRKSILPGGLKPTDSCESDELLL